MIVPVKEIAPPLEPGPEGVPPGGATATPPFERIVPLTLMAPALVRVKLPPLEEFEDAERSAPAAKEIPPELVVIVRLFPAVVRIGVIEIGPAIVNELPLSTLTAAALEIVKPLKLETFPPKVSCPTSPLSRVRLRAVEVVKV